MVVNTALKCQPLDKPLNNNRIAFGSEKTEEPKKETVKPDNFEKKEAEPNSEKKKGKVKQATGAIGRVIRHFKEMDYKNAKEEFFKGVISPAKAIIDHPLVGGTTLAGGFLAAKYIKKFNLTKLAKLSLLGSAGIAAYNVGKGVYDFVTAKTPKEKEKSFYDMGQGAIYGAFAVVPAKKVAINDNIPGVTETTNRLKAFGACLKTVPKDIVNITKAIGSAIKTNELKPLQSALRPYASTAVVSGTELTAGSPDASTIDPPDVYADGDGNETGSGRGLENEVVKDIKEAVVGEEGSLVKDALQKVEDRPTLGLELSERKRELGKTGNKEED